MPLLCTRFDEENTRSRQGSKKVFQKFSKIFGRLKNSTYLCIRFDKETLFRKSEKVLKKSFSKKYSKKFGGLKNLIYLCTTFRSEKNKWKFGNGSLIYWF